MNPLLFIKAVLRESGGWSIGMAVVLGLSLSLGITVSMTERAVRHGSARAGDDFDLLVGARGSSVQLMLGAVYLRPQALPLIPGATVAEALSQDGVVWAAPLVFGDRFGDAPLVGTTEALVTLGGKRQLAEGHCFTTLDEAVVGAGVPLAIGAEFSPAHGQIAGHAHEHVHYRVSGRLPATGTPWDRAILVPAESVWAAHDLVPEHDVLHPGDAFHNPLLPVPGISAMVIKPASIAAAYRLRAYWQGVTRELDTNIESLSPDAPPKPGNTVGMQGVFTGEVLTELFATLGDMRDVMQWMAWAAQCTALCAVMLAGGLLIGTCRKSLTLLRMLGAPRPYLLLGVWGLVSSSVVLGVILGLLAGWGAAELITLGLFRKTGIALTVALSATEIRFAGLSLILGTACAFIPAFMVYINRDNSL